MPWTADDAERSTRSANTPRRKRLWSHVANKMLAEHGDEGAAKRAANAAVRRDHRNKPRTTKE
jgi:hypothetical protein